MHKKNPLHLSKNATYYQYSRPEVVDLIAKLRLPVDRVLELGCSSGATGKAIRERFQTNYYEGFELSEEAATIARQTLDKVQVADIEKVLLEEAGLGENEFDLLMGLDIFEHLYDPWETMAKFVRCLKVGGHVVVSIPNVQHISVLEGLSRGQWPYASAGLLDATHVRFFTIDGIAELLTGAGLSIIDTSIVFSPSIDLTSIQPTGNRIELDKIHLVNLEHNDVLRLFAYQYIVAARKA